MADSALRLHGAPQLRAGLRLPWEENWLLATDFLGRTDNGVGWLCGQLSTQRPPPGVCEVLNGSPSLLFPATCSGPDPEGPGAVCRPVPGSRGPGTLRPPKSCAVLRWSQGTVCAQALEADLGGLGAVAWWGPWRHKSPPCPQCHQEGISGRVRMACPLQAV